MFRDTPGPDPEWFDWTYRKTLAKTCGRVEVLQGLQVVRLRERSRPRALIHVWWEISREGTTLKAGTRRHMKEEKKFEIGRVRETQNRNYNILD